MVDYGVNVTIDISQEKLDAMKIIKPELFDLLMKLPLCEWGPNLTDFARKTNIPASSVFDKMKALQDKFELQLILRLKEAKDG